MSNNQNPSNVEDAGLPRDFRLVGQTIRELAKSKPGKPIVVRYKDYGLIIERGPNEVVVRPCLPQEDGGNLKFVDVFEDGTTVHSGLPVDCWSELCTRLNQLFAGTYDIVPLLNRAISIRPIQKR